LTRVIATDGDVWRRRAWKGIIIIMMMMEKIWCFESFRVKKSCFCLEVTERRASFVGNVFEETTLRTVRTRNGKRKRGKWTAGMNVFVSGTRI
jgi:hypothetical protein